MSREPDPKQTLLMLRLIFGKTAPTKTELSAPALLEELQTQGLVCFEKRGRSTHVLVTDKGWQWTQANLHVPFNPQGINPGRILLALLPKLQDFLERQGWGLAQLFEAPDTRSDTRAASSLPPAGQARAALLALGGGKTRQRLTLAQARAALPNLSAEGFDQALLQLQEDGSVALYHEDNPENRSADVEAAAIRIAGSRYHLVYLLE